MSCKVKTCEENAIVILNLFVKGFPVGTSEVELCEMHARGVNSTLLRLKNGGRVDVVDSHCIE